MIAVSVSRHLSRRACGLYEHRAPLSPLHRAAGLARHRRSGKLSTVRVSQPVSSSATKYTIPTSKPWYYQAITCGVCCGLEDGLVCGLADKLLRSFDTGMHSTPEAIANTNRPGHVITRRDRESGETSTLIDGRLSSQAAHSTHHAGSLGPHLTYESQLLPRSRLSCNTELGLSTRLHFGNPLQSRTHQKHISFP